jgi:hypothetical protein
MTRRIKYLHPLSLITETINIHQMRQRNTNSCLISRGILRDSAANFMFIFSKNILMSNLQTCCVTECSVNNTTSKCYPLHSTPKANRPKILPPGHDQVWYKVTTDCGSTYKKRELHPITRHEAERRVEVQGVRKRLYPLCIFFSRCPVCGKWCKLH